MIPNFFLYPLCDASNDQYSFLLTIFLSKIFNELFISLKPDDCFKKITEEKFSTFKVL